MKNPLFILFAAWPSLMLAGERTSANYSITADTADAGGRGAASPNYSIHGSASLIAGVSTIAAPAGTAKAGYIGQLYDVSSLSVNSATPDINETETLQLAAWQLLDDATLLAVDANAVTWSIVSGPIASISASGLATAALVFEDTPATVEGTFGGYTGALYLTVLDSIPDNFGDYAGDGLGDDWQVQFFGQNNPLAAPALDPDGDGANNLFEFTAGLAPTDPASTFHLTIAPVPGQPARKKIVFSPRLDGRTYSVEARPALETGAWQPLPGSTQTDDGPERTVTDLNATGAKKLYRVQITRP